MSKNLPVNRRPTQRQTIIMVFIMACHATFIAHYQTSKARAQEAAPALQIDPTPSKMSGSGFAQNLETVMPSLHLDKNPSGGLNKNLRQLILTGAAFKDKDIGLLSGLDQLQYLDLSSSGISDESLEAIANLKSLRVLKLDFCRHIHGSKLGILAKLPNLQYLSLHSLGLNDSCGPNLQKIVSLKHLVLDNNHVTYQTIKCLTALPALDALSLAHCSEIDNECLATIASIKHLRQLNLRATNLNNEPLFDLTTATLLEDLNLSANKIGDLAFSSLGKMPNLRTLDLSQTQAGNATLTDLKPCQKIRYLDLSATRIDSRAMPTLSAFAGLTCLAINYLIVNDHALAQAGAMPNLQVLEAEHIDVINDLNVLNNCPHLRRLSLVNTYVTSAALANIGNLQKLQYLSLMSTNLDTAGLHNLKDLTTLNTLDLSSTKCGDTNLQFLPCLTNLHTLSLANTRVTDQIVTVLQQIPDLEQLELSGSRVTLKREKIEAVCKKLHTLDLPYGNSGKLGLSPQ